MSEGNELPSDWTTVPLVHLIAESKNGFGKRRQEGGHPTIVLRLADIKEGEICLEDVRRINATTQDLDEYSLRPNDLLAIRVNGSPNLVGRLVRFQGAAEPVLFCDHFIRMRLRNSSFAKFIRFYGDTHTVRHFIDQNKVCSAGQNTISQGSIGAMEVPVPPLPEQRRIVAKIEELFSDLDAGVAALERVRANLKRYRASVLKAAVEGRLTEKWRKENPSVEPATKLLQRILTERRKKWEEQQLAKFTEAGKSPPKNWRDKYEEPAAPDTTDLPELPKGWCWATVEQLLIENSCNGISVKGSNEPPGVPALRLSAMSDDGFDYAVRRYIPISDSVADGLAIRRCDFFVARGNGSLHLVGRGTLAQEPGERIVFPDTMIRLRLADVGGLRSFISTIWSSQFIRSQIEKKARTTAGIYKISQTDVDGFIIPLPPLAEQDAVISEVQARSSIILKNETDVSGSLLRSVRLRQSILKRAFEGKLIPQDPKDELASVLLERSRREREARVANRPTAKLAKRGVRR